MRHKMQALIVFILLGVFSYAQDNGDKKEKRKQSKQEVYEEVKALVLSRKYEFVADQALPTGYRSVNLIGNPNYLRVSNDSVQADMPFFGRAYQATPGERGGIRFDNLAQEYKVEMNEKKQRIAVSFEVREEGKYYQCRLQIGSKESVSLSIISSHLQQISYNGELKEQEVEE